MMVQALLDAATTAHRDGRLAEAIAGYRQVLAIGGGASIMGTLSGGGQEVQKLFLPKDSH